MLVKSDSASHWYNRDGSPAYRMPNKSKEGFHPTTLRDARKHSLVPSVTTIQKIVSKPQLQDWITTQAVLSALTLPRQKEESDDSFAKRVIEDSRQESLDAASKGSAIHDSIDLAIRGTEVDDEFEPFVRPVVDWFKSSGIELCETERSFACGFYGGRIDFIGEQAGHPVIIDWKTQGTKKGKFVYYPEWGEQLAAYSYGRGKPKARLMNVVVSTSQPGLMDVREWTNQQYLYDTFMLQYKLWCNRNNYYPEGE